MSNWSSLKSQKHQSSHSNLYQTNPNQRQLFNSAPSPFSNTTTSNNSQDYHRNSKGPFSPDGTDEVDECCSYIGQLLINDSSHSHRDSRVPSSYQNPPFHSKYSNKPSTMTIGHHHHYNNRHHYPYHDHYHDDSPLLPRIEFPSSQFDRLLRGSPNLNRSSDTTNRFTSSTRDTSSSNSLSNTSTSSSYSSNSSSKLSWKSGPFDGRRK